jgi:hypothetical protein
MRDDQAQLEAIVAALAAVRLEAIMVGNAAAVVHDAPVMTQDVDFFIRQTPLNLKKVRLFGDQIGGLVSAPFEPLSRMIRVQSENATVDFIFSMGARRFESVRSRATRITFGKASVWVASLEDVIAAKRAAGRPKDLAVLPVLEQTLATKRKMKELS